MAKKGELEAAALMAALKATPLRKMFVAGRGVGPRYFTGRDEELRELEGWKQLLIDKAPPGKDLLLVGPRGNGKTVLLAKFQKMLETSETLDVVTVSADELGDDISDVISLVAARSWMERKFGASMAQIGSKGANVQLNWSAAALSRSLRECLQDRVKDKPFVLLVDEAHELDQTVGRSLLNAFQSVQRDDGACLLVLAGTPGLIRHLGEMSATFASRNKKIRVGLLDEEAAKDCLRTPFAAHGITFEPGVMDKIIDDSCRYPYFLQLWGEELSRELGESGGDTITLKHYEAAYENVDDVRNDYYEERRRELRGPIGDCALAISRLYLDHSGVINVSPKTFDELCAALPENRLKKDETIDHLENRGVVWQVKSDEYVPGIPSLFHYLQKKLAQPRQEVKEPAMIFKELARTLSEAYSHGYSDRYAALQQFGRAYTDQLVEMQKQGKSLTELVQKAEIGGADHWVKEIEKGMSQ